MGLERCVAATRALTSACDTYSLDYRLAPQHPFPAALDDAVSAYRTLLEQRLPVYREAASVEVATDHLTAQEVVDRITAELPPTVPAGS